MSLDKDYPLNFENTEGFSGFKLVLDNFNHLIAVRKSENPYRYDIYHNKENHPKYLGRVKVNRNLTISKDSKEFLSKTNLKDSDKEALKFLIDILNANNSAFMRFLWVRYSDSDKYHHIYIDERIK